MKFLILFALVVVATCERLRYDGCDVWKLKPKTEKQLRQLYSLFERHDDESDRQIIFWEAPRFVDENVEVLVCPSGASELASFLGFSGISGEVSQQNIQSDLDAVFAQSDARHLVTSAAFDPDNFNTYEDIMAYLDELQSNCPSGVSCSVETIGSSYQGRDIKAFRMTKTGSNRRGIWIDSLTHCREWLSGATVLGIMGTLVNEYGSNSDATNLVDKYNWHFVPVVNPDGYTYTWSNDRMWRKTRSPNQGSLCTGTDANRNFDYMWGTPGASTSPCSETYRGSGSASEVEVQTIQAAGEALRGELVLWLTFHTFGEYYLYPFGSINGGRCDTAPDQAALDRVGQVAISAIQATFNQGRWISGSTCQALYAASGSTCDWAYGTGIAKYSYTPELRGPGFNPSPSAIQPSIQENWNGLVAMVSEIEDIEGFF